MKAGDMNRWDWLTRDFTTTKQATNFLKTHTIVWEYSNGGSLYSGSDCILDVWLARKTENTISIYNGDLLHQDIRREKRWQEVSTSHQAGEIKVTFSDRRPKWNEPWWVGLVGAGVMEETQLLSDIEFEAENEEEKHPDFSLFPCQYLVSTHC